MLCILSHNTMKVKFEITLDVGGGLFDVDPEIVASCNALVCLRKRNSLCISIWNPATSERLKSLPPIARGYPYKTQRVGFGFDRGSNEFKVLAIFNYPDRIIQASVYNLSTGAWRQLDIPLPFY